MDAMALRAVGGGKDGPDGPEDPPGVPRMVPAVEVTIAALGCPDSDAAVVALARTIAATIDGMQGGQRGMMLGQTAPLLLKTLQELEDRSRKRRARSATGRPSKVAQLRAAHAASPGQRRRAGG